MTGRDAGYVKQTRISEIKKEMATKVARGVPKDRLLDWIECTIGLSKAKANEYVDLITRVAGWVEIDGKIFSDLPEV